MSATPALRLSQLAARIHSAVNAVFSDALIWVVADVTGHTFKPTGGYHFFELLEKSPDGGKILARFPATAWGAGAASIRKFEEATGQRFADPIRVMLRVQVEYHAVYGIQLRAEEVDINYALGMIEQQRRQVLERLVRDNPGVIRKYGDGYETRNQLLPLPPAITRLAIISSRNSAGLQDFLHTLETNHFGYRFDISYFYTEVQGEANAPGIRQALLDIYHAPPGVDLVVLIRGGGAASDLLIFDQYLVGQAIARFPIPVMTGIGHTRNISVADLMAHTSVKTPTGCAEFIIAHNRRFEEDLLEIRQRLAMRSQQQMAGAEAQLKELVGTLAQKSTALLHERQLGVGRLSATLQAVPRVRLAEKLRDLSSAASGLVAAQSALLREKRRDLDHLGSFVRLSSPAGMLKRGFAILLKEDRILSAPASLSPGDTVRVLVKQTALQVTINQIEPYDGKDTQF